MFFVAWLTSSRVAAGMFGSSLAIDFLFLRSHYIGTLISLLSPHEPHAFSNDFVVLRVVQLAHIDSYRQALLRLGSIQVVLKNIFSPIKLGVNQTLLLATPRSTEILVRLTTRELFALRPSSFVAAFKSMLVRDVSGDDRTLFRGAQEYLPVEVGMST